MMRMFFAAALAALLGLSATAAEQKFALDGANTKLTFTGTKKAGKHDGGFKKLTGTATIDGTDLTTLKIEAVIDTTSLYSDNDKLTAHLKTPDFFGVKDHPKATFKSTKVEKTERLHDHRRPDPARQNEAGDHAGDHRRERPHADHHQFVQDQPLELGHDVR